RRRRAKREPGVLRQVQEDSTNDVRRMQIATSVPPGAPIVPRLGFCTFGPHQFDAAQLALSIRSRPGVLHFCDSTQFIAPTCPRVWDALLAGRQLAIIPQILQELKWWLEDPRENVDMHKLVRAGLHGDPGAPIAWIKLESREQITACEYHVNL